MLVLYWAGGGYCRGTGDPGTGDPGAATRTGTHDRMSTMPPVAAVSVVVLFLNLSFPFPYLSLLALLGNAWDVYAIEDRTLRIGP